MAPPNLGDNKANRILRNAVEGRYGIAAVCVYNLEGILATIRAAENKDSPAMILLFPWALSYSGPLLSLAAHTAASKSRVPVTVHLDHAQSPDDIHTAADSGHFDSIMVDMSHHPPEENLRLTAELTEYCHHRGIATEAEPGRIEGGEDGVQDTKELEGMMTSREQARQFVDTGIDWLAPAFGNVHGKYGPRGIQLDYDRLEGINAEVSPDGTRLVLHGTDGFDEKIYAQCIQRGITKVNLNRNVNEIYTTLQAQGGLGLTALMEKGTQAMQEEIEKCMDWLGSSGKA